ncbi:beta-galactosidase [Microbacterium sp. AZCO]|uniref:beta-galactosidase n=1 Tax=Microbacterium sp. AZCO TaxID=3142976 RepID=UPI0031F4584C
MIGTEASLLTARHRGVDAAPRRPRMANEEEHRAGLELTSRSLLRDGRPWIPVSGELHYSRVPRARWARRLAQLRAGGVTVVSTYVPWIHHEPERGRRRFDGDLDLAAFVDAVRAQGLEFVLRIGPWIHGEVRNGGFPDWVQAAPVRHRTDDPAYLALVADWWGAVASVLDGRCRPENVLAIQLDNELYDQPAHLMTLKRLAREAGLAAPLWTATAWGGAQLPDPEVLPLWGGYGDGFWVDSGEPWDPTFRAHFFFSDDWDDPGIGADVRGEGASALSRLSPWFPPATCELGGGMATAYHRRPRPDALDIAAVAHAKLGSGSAWQGYYMYAGGTNPGPGLEETQATGYPNDLTPLSYDFHAPVGEAGRLAPSHAVLRRQHAFIEAFGDRLADMPATLPDERPAGVEDSSTLRWALRSDGREGFLFIGWHQPHVPLPVYRGAHFALAGLNGEVRLPSRPVDIPPGTLARWPFGLVVGGVRIAWATASVLTLLPGAVPTLVLLEDAGVPVEVSTGDEVRVVVPGAAPLRLATADGALDLLVLPADADVWVASTPAGRRLLLSPDELMWDAATGRLSVHTVSRTPDVREYDPSARAFAPVVLEHAGGRAGAASLPTRLVREGRLPSGDYGSRDGRHTAPGDDVIDRDAAVWQIHVPAAAEATLRIRWAGDVAQLRVDGRTVRDRFWDGSDFLVDVEDCGIGPHSLVELRVLGLPGGTEMSLPAGAAGRAAGGLLGLDGVQLEERALWRETT